MKYFENCKTAEDVKKTFHKWAAALHPDNGGSEEDFKAMMTEYTQIFNRLKNIHETASGEEYTKETTETPEQFAEIVNKIIHFDGVKIEIIGSWIWLSGNTYAYKDQIKEAGFFYSKNKKSWYYNGDTERKHHRGHYTMNQLKEKFDVTEIKTEKQAAIA